MYQNWTAHFALTALDQARMNRKFLALLAIRGKQKSLTEVHEL
jgi:hypothetical protein